MNKTFLLNSLYNDINDIIIKRQHPVTGLLPASTAITNHGDYTDAWVRDNVYSIMSVWSLSMAYRRNGEKIRCDELEQSTIKLMRGLLQSMMRQAPKVEKFKHTSHPMDCLHAKYDTNTGLNVVDDHEWGHLQIDATSLFLLMIAQMSASGLRIINTIDEVAFIQNLIYYIAFAYRTPDYGIWERGNKINNGKTEINASSVGMAKAALQALDGLNLFGRDGNPRAVVHTIPDAISRARNTLSHLLPRESMSKEVDSAILSIIGFPAFAVGNQDLVSATRDKILSELGGKFGCKRFLWDGHQTAIEDHSRMYYEHSELADFEHIESEWPLFYTYLYIQALFENDTAGAKKYRDHLESLMVEVDGKHLLPELYYVGKEDIEAERKDPGSQPRQPNENIPLVWAQSLYFTGLMLDEGLLEQDDLDPLKLRSRSTKSTDVQIALVVMAENESVKEQLAEKGVLAETINEISPINVISSAELVEAYRKLGANTRLGLTGRPKRRFQGLATAQTYVINEQTYLSLSSLQYAENNYRLFDAELACSNLKQEIIHINKHWINDEVAVFTYLLTQDMCDAVNADALLKTIRDLQLRNTHKNVGYASANLAIRASRVNNLIMPNANVKALVETPMTSNVRMFAFDLTSLSDQMQHKLKAFEQDDETGYQQLQAWTAEFNHDSELSQQPESSITFDTLVGHIYSIAQHKQHWLTTRFCFSLLSLVHKDLVDDVSLVCARHVSIVVGNDNQLVLNDAHALLKPKDLTILVDNACSNLIERTLVQELIVILGNAIRTNTAMFDGLRSIKLNNLFALCADQPECNEATLVALATKSPYQLNKLVQQVLATQLQAFTHDVEFCFSEQILSQTQTQSKLAMDTDWLQWRSQRGLMTRFDDQLLKDIWQSLGNAQAIVFADNSHAAECLDSLETRSSMTPQEESFAHKIDGLTQHLHPIYYKAAMVEVLKAYTEYCIKHPEATFDKIVLGHTLQQAADLFVQENNLSDSDERNLDVLMNQSPDTLQAYALKVFSLTN